MSKSVIGHIYSRVDLKWDGPRLRLKTGRLLATVEPDGKWPAMYRARLPNGHLTDMVNLTRAKDATIALACTELNKPKRDISRVRAPLVSQSEPAATALSSAA
jgi:hypothetical protein